MMTTEDNEFRPLFSVITVTYNAERELPATLRSVEEQSFRQFEHLIIDGASSDETLRIANSELPQNRTVVSSPDRGIYDAMNRGLGMAKGEYVIFLNAGDRFHSPSTLQRVAEQIMNYDFPGVVYGQTDIVDADGNKLADRHLRAPEILTYDSFKQGMVVCHQSFFALRRIAENFDLRYRYSADYEWCIRVLQHSRMNIYMDQVLSDYLMEGTSTRHRRASLLERFRIMAYYYGFFPTLLRHLSFLPRFLRRRRLEESLNTK